MFWSVQESSIDGEEHCLNDEQGVADEPGAAESDKLEGHGITDFYSWYYWFTFFKCIVYIFWFIIFWYFNCFKCYVFHVLFELFNIHFI